MAMRRQAQFVGRDAELEMLAVAVHSVCSGNPELVIIEGESGLGKSRLLWEAIDRYRPENALVVQAHGVALMGDQLPYGIVAEAVRSSVRGSVPTERLPRRAKAIANAFTSPEPGAALESLRREDLFGGFTSLIEALASEAFVWLVVEDAHWADESSLELLAYVAKVVTSCSFLTTYTVRTGSSAPSAAYARFATETGRSLNTSTIALQPLDAPAVAALVADLTRQRPTRRLMDRLLALANGNPFLTEELVSGGITAEGPVPASPQAAMVGRVKRLSPDCADLVAIASLAHGSFSFDHLRGLLPFDDDRLDAALEEAAAEGVLEPEPASDCYRFHHALLKEAVAAAVPPARRRRSHRTWAEVREGGSIDEIDPWLATVAAAHHWIGSGDVERAFDACVRAVNLAPTFHAPSERAPLLAAALQLWDRVPDAGSRSGWTRDQLAMDTIRGAHFAGDWDVALGLIDAELRHPDSDHDPVRRACLELSRQGTLEQLNRALLADFEPRLDELADILLRAPDGPWLANGCLDAAWRIGVSPRPERRSALLERASSAALAQNDPVARLNAGQALADNLAAEGRLDDALAVVHDLLKLTSERLPERVSDVEAQLSWYLCFRGEISAGLAIAERAMRRIPSATLSSRLFAYVAGNLAYALVELGRWDEADHWLGEALRAYPHGWTAFELHAESIRLTCYRGDVAVAAELADELWALVPHDERRELVSIGRGGRARIVRAMVAGAQGDVAEVRQLLAPVWAIPELREETDVAWRAVLVAAAAEAAGTNRTRRQGRSPDTQSTESNRHMETIQAVAADLYTPGPLGVTWPQHFAAERARYQHEDTADIWRSVAAAWDAIGVPHDRAWALLHAAECHLTHDETESAQSAILEAHEIATRLGAKPLEQALLNCAGRARLQLVRPERDIRMFGSQRLHGLTGRERFLTTVMFTDIVGSTHTAAGLGDRAWGALLERHHTFARAMISRYRGVEVDTAGDGFFATFDSPAQAVLCAQAIVDAVRALDIEIRAGIHTGEVEQIDGKAGGIAVTIGARVGALASASEVLVSQTVRDLTAGSGLLLEDAGEYELKGVPERWHVYRAIS